MADSMSQCPKAHRFSESSGKKLGTFLPNIFRHDIKGKEKTHAAPNFCKDLEVSLATGHGMANKLVILHADCSYLGFKEKTTCDGLQDFGQRLVLANCLSI